MRNFYFCIFIFFIGFHLHSQVINFPDPVFKAKLLAADITNNTAQDASGNNIKIDVNSNGEIEQNEALLVYRLFYTSNPPIRPQSQHASQSTHALADPITNVTGISYFANLRQLDLSDNQIQDVNLSALSSLQMLICKNSGVQTLHVAGLSALAYLNCSDNQLTELSLTGLNVLQTLICQNNQLTQLIPAGLGNLQYLLCNNNAMASIHFGGNPLLTYVYCAFNQLAEIDLHGTSAVVLHCSDNPNLATIKTKNGVDSPFTYDEFPQPPMDAFDFANLPALETVCCDANEVSVMAQVLAAQPAVSVATDCLPPSIIHFADDHFKTALLTTDCVNYQGDLNTDGDADLNNDGEIDTDEALLMQGMSIGANGIADLDGLQYFENLTSFGIGGNPLTHFDGYGLENLVTLSFSENQITDIDLSGLLLLETFEMIREPELTQIDFSNNTELFFARFWEVPVATLNFCGTALRIFDGQMLPNLTYFSSKNGIVTTDGVVSQTPPPLSPIQLIDCPMLETVCYDPGEYAFINWGDALDGVAYVTDCPADCSILSTQNPPLAQWAVYPNPAKDVLHIKTENTTVDSIEIVNQLGQTVQVLQQPGATIDIRHLTKGVYLLRMHADSKTETSKLIKQ